MPCFYDPPFLPRTISSRRYGRWTALLPTVENCVRSTLTWSPRHSHEKGLWPRKQVIRSTLWSLGVLVLNTVWQQTHNLSISKYPCAPYNLIQIEGENHEGFLLGVSLSWNDNGPSHIFFYFCKFYTAGKSCPWERHSTLHTVSRNACQIVFVKSTKCSEKRWL